MKNDEMRKLIKVEPTIIVEIEQLSVDEHMKRMLLKEISKKDSVLTNCREE